MVKRQMVKNIIQTDYRKKMWDRMEAIAYPGEHNNLFGHDEAIQLFCDAFKSSRMHHAWLVSGPKGIGKASFALAMAGHIMRTGTLVSDNSSNEINEKEYSPLIDDAISSKIARGGHPNLLHLSRPFDHKVKKFKSTLSVDEIRRTIGFFGTSAGEPGWRVCIVDTADDMNSNAANALLKILEEPPKRTVFFILANSPGRLLATIRSRCRHLPLRPLDGKNLNLALDAAGVDTGQLDGDDTRILFRLSNGSVRKAILLLEEGGLDISRRFEAILKPNGSQNPDWLLAHKLADEFSRKNKEDQYRLLLDIASEYVSQFLYRGAIKTNKPMAQSTLSNLARMCEVWEKNIASANLADNYNLDRKQVILNLFGSLAKVRWRLNIQL